MLLTMDHCDDCGFTYADHSRPGIAQEIHDLAGRYRSVLTDAAIDETRLRIRPAPGVWSPVEYGCHVRDVLLAQRERLLLALVEDEPTFVPIYRDQRAALARYSDEASGQVASEITLAAELLAWVLIGLAGPDWQRTCVYTYPEPSVRTLLWLAQHTLHEGEHHLKDIERATSAMGER
jgi:S-DNA-T family DNA segregation ATPase FtsK/SpoIIIE